MQDIKELPQEELKKVLKDWQEPEFHSQQIFSWLYKKGIHNFDQMSDLPADLRKRLKENFYLSNLKLIKMLESKDGTQKFLLELNDKNIIEAVSIPTEKRITGCISTQVGCKFSCKFCASGALGFKRNLTIGEMIEEVLYLKEISEKPFFCADTRRLHTDSRGFYQREYPRPSVLHPRKSAFSKKLTHLVFMGMGEPLDNYDNVIKAIRIINSPYALNIGARRITISSAGIIPGIKRLADEDLQIELSVSLHSADDKIRSEIMPVNKIYPLKGLISTCQEYIKKTNRQITFEYILIKEINSGLEDAAKLSKLLKGLKLCKVNLIPTNPINPVRDNCREEYGRLRRPVFNGVKEFKIEPPNKIEILFFRDYLLKQGINVTLRSPRGQDIEAACGQLRLRYEKKSSQVTSHKSQEKTFFALYSLLATRYFINRLC